MRILESIKTKVKLARLKKLTEDSFANGQITYDLYRRIMALDVGSDLDYVRALMEGYQLFARSSGFYKSHPNMKHISERWLERTLKERNIEDEIGKETNCQEGN